MINIVHNSIVDYTKQLSTSITLTTTTINSTSTMSYLLQPQLMQPPLYLPTTWSFRIRSFSGPYFPAFGLNTERYEVSLRIQSECGKIRTRKTPNKDIFYAVTISFLVTFFISAFYPLPTQLSPDPPVQLMY